MKKIKKANELLWFMGIVCIAFSVAICSKSNLGVSMLAAPAFILSEAVQPVASFVSVGTAEYILQGMLLVAMCIAVKKIKLRYFLAFVVAMMYGRFLDLFLMLIKGFECGSFLSQLIVLLVGDIICAFGVACCFKTYMPLLVYELFVAVISEEKKIDIGKFKGYFDKGMFALSILMILCFFRDWDSFNLRTILRSDYHSIGVGTIITVIINTPLIALMSRIIDKCFDSSPRFEKLKEFLK